MKIEISKARNPLAELFAQPPSAESESESLKLAFSDELLALMKAHSISRAELARRMKIQPSRVTAMLSGVSNLTIDTMVRAARAVGASLHQKLVPAGQKVRWQCWEEGDAPAISFAPLKNAESTPAASKVAEGAPSYGAKRETSRKRLKK